MYSVKFSYTCIVLAILCSQFPHFSLGYASLLTCNQTLETPFIPIPMKCINIGYDLQYNYTKCTKMYRSQRGSIWTLELILRWLRFGFNENHNQLINNNYNCLSASELSGETDLDNKFYMVFSTFNIGDSNYTCDSVNGRNCSLEVKLRKDVLALPPFSFTPDEPEFWNFSSPLFGPELKWLTSLHLTGSLTVHYPHELPGLAGSSVQDLFIIGSFGTDQRGALPHLDNLPFLYFLTTINSSMDFAKENLIRTRNIRVLKLLKNKFANVPNAVSQQKNLRELTFESTEENFNFSSEALHGLDYLNFLSLSGSKIEQWIMPHFRKLETLKLNSCKLRRFSASKNQFIVPTLRQLHLKDNFLSALTTDAFTGVPNLFILDLSYNSIIQLSPKIFASLRLLNSIYLQRNNLTNWPVLPYNQFDTIDLSQNSLNNLIKLGDYILSVDYIDISNNRISGWKDENIFKRAQFSARVTKISNAIPINAVATGVNLSNNFVTIFSQTMLSSLSVLKKVDLGGNMINCGDCETSHLQQWLASTSTVVYNLGISTALTCYQPTEFKNRSVEKVNFAEICYIPRRYLLLWIGAPIVGVIVIVVIGSVIFYYRTEVVYLAHLAKIRATSKNKTQTPSSACYDAFICYSGKNRKWVMRRLVPLLERRPEFYSLCLFDRDFALGSHIVTNIVDAIDQSRKVIVILTQHFIDSKWCQWELEMAQHKLFSEDREFLVLLELEPLERRRLPRLLRFLLDTRPVVRWPRPETAPAVMAAAAELRAVLGPSLRQQLLAGPPPGDEPLTSASAADERTPLLADDHTQEN